MTRMVQSAIAFAIPRLTPGRCGVCDYATRMAGLLIQRGIPAILLAVEGDSIGTNLETVEATIPTGHLHSREAATGGVLAVQYVPGFGESNRQFHQAVTNCAHPRVHLMIHECWRMSMRDSRLPLRGRLVAYRQKLLLKRLIKKWGPKTMATSNRYYQTALRNEGIHVECSPMPGTIPVTGQLSPPENLELPSWWTIRHQMFLWVSFGSLYTHFWDSSEMFRQAQEISSTDGQRFAWVIAGKLDASEQEAFLRAAANHGLSEYLHFTGPLPSAAVDWWLRQADASFSGSPGEVWGKSTGILAAVERRLPVLLPRGWSDGTLEIGGRFTPSIAQTLDLAGVRGSPSTSKIGDSDWRTLDEVAAQFSALTGLRA
jgi:hypothetical protein